MALRGDDKVVPEEWERVKELFESALDCSVDDRPAFLARLEREYPHLADQVSRLLASHERAGDFLNFPLIFPADFLDDLEEPQRFSQDEVLCNRFKIIRLIGKGGMGEVYEAFDQELEERVALKTLRFEVSSNEIFTARFRREIQLARKVTHPNVCRIFESLRHQPGSESISVLSMELLQGQTLGEYLKTKGRLTADEALPLARQIIEGLSAVHEAGIIHRDLKPSNLILVPDGDAFQVKITDFGIAGRLPENPSQPALTQASKMLGTPDYMAPEQLEQGRATIQSDIYSLGLVLYEMVTGSKPFVETGAWKRLYQDPRPPKKLSPDLPDHWNKTIVCCLERDPQYRFCSASAVGESLSGDAAIAPIPPRPYILRLKMAVRKGAWLILAFFVVIAALAIPVVRYFRQGAEIPPGTTVLVTDIATDDPALAGITVALKSQLAQSAHFEIEEATKIVDTLKQMDRKPGDPLDAKTAREVAWRSGVPLVVFGSLTSARDGYLLSMAVERVKHSPLFPTLAWKRDFLAQDKTGLLNVVHDASSWVRMLAGEATRDMAQQDRPVEDTTTSSWQALQLYTAAEYKYSAGDIDAALLILREAIQADPDFAKAHMRLADILISKKNYKEGYAEWRTAFSLTDKRQLTSREALRLKGLYYADNGYYNEAESTFRQFTIHYPYDDLAWFYLGNSLEELGRTDDSIAAFTQAATLRLTSPYPHIHLALLHFATRDSKSASAEIQNVKHLGQIRWVNWLTAYAAFFDERYDQAVEQASVLLDSSTAAEKSDGYSIKATYLAELGHRREAISLLLEGSDFDRNHGLANDEAGKEIGLAYLYYREGEISQSRTRAMHAVNLDDSPQRLLEAGTLLALSRDLPSSQFCLERLKVQPSTPRVQAAINRLQGEIELAKNNFRSALAYFTKATSKARPIDTREFLARGLAVAGRNNEAAMVLQSLADAPARVLLDRGNDWPGLWGDTLFKLSTVKAKDGDVPCQYAQRYLRLRDNAGNKLDGEVIAVRRLFEQYCNSQPN